LNKFPTVIILYAGAFCATPDGGVKVADLGLSCTPGTADPKSIYKCGASGTPNYQSQEMKNRATIIELCR